MLHIVGRWHVRSLAMQFAICTILAALTFIQVCAAQSTQGKRQPGEDFQQEFKKYPGLLPEFGTLFQKLQNGVQFPPDRNQSRLLPRLSPVTSYYAAFPNYGEPAHQALTIFQQELQENAVLRSWWSDAVGPAGPAIVGSIEKFYALSQFIGDEVVITGDSGAGERSFMLVAEIRKPGLKNFLEQMLKEAPATSTPKVRIMSPEELASDSAGGRSGEWTILVRPDFLVAASTVNAVRDFNQQLEKRTTAFSTTDFGQRIAQGYQGGASILLAADLQKLLAAMPRTTQSDLMFNRTGFNDLKYFTWDHKNVDGHAASEMELSFTGPRRGMAAWLASPAPLGSLDFVSPKAMGVTSVKLKNVGQIFDEIRQFSNESNPNPFAMLDQMQKMFNINFKNDLLDYLDGEITFELDGVTETEPVWRGVLRVNHPDRLQQTLTKLIAATQPGATQSAEGGVTYHSVVVPSQQKPMQIVYAIVDGYLIVAPTQESAAEAVRLRRSGEGLGKSSKFLAALPSGSTEASAIFYQDPVAMTAARLQHLSPEMTDIFSHIQTPPMAVAAYGDNNSIRAASSGGGADVAGVLIMSAIAVPNLLRTRTSANDAAAVGSMRNIVTAQVAYAATYPDRGFSRDLASLGPNPQSNTVSAQHAGLLNSDLADPSCTGSNWCTKSGYKFSVAPQCKQRKCIEFVVTATPLSSNTGTKNLCSTSDGVIRFQAGPTLALPVTSTQCRQWAPLQ